MKQTLPLIAFLSIVLAGCHSGPPECADERVLAAVKRLVVQKHIAITTERIRGRRKAGVLRLGSEWLESATFTNTRTDEYEEGAKRYACRTTAIVPMLPSILEKRRQTGFDAVFEKRTGKKPDNEPATLEINYSVAKSGDRESGFTVAERTLKGTHRPAPLATLIPVLKMDEMERISATAATFLGRWKGTFHCDSDVFIPYPEHKPPPEWVAPFSQEVELVVQSVFDIPPIHLLGFTPPTQLVWTTNVMQPVLTVTIPYYTELERVVDGIAGLNAISFGTAAHGDVVVNLQGKVHGDSIEASGEAQRGAGMLYSKKQCAMTLKRQQ
ncbi:MAG: hypothetical protein M0Q22_01935 [Sulfuritalea sp.]|nr:hypothetical protein [Sulfuritalea sp.]